MEMPANTALVMISPWYYTLWISTQFVLIIIQSSFLHPVFHPPKLKLRKLLYHTIVAHLLFSLFSKDWFNYSWQFCWFIQADVVLIGQLGNAARFQVDMVTSANHSGFETSSFGVQIFVFEHFILQSCNGQELSIEWWKMRVLNVFFYRLKTCL